MPTFRRCWFDKIVANPEFHHWHQANEADSCELGELAEPTQEAPQVHGKPCPTNVGPSGAVN